MPVRQLLALTAQCPNCGASLNDAGLRMRKLVDETATAVNALKIITQAEKLLNVTIPDEFVEEIDALNELTLADLAAVAHRSSPSSSSTVIDDVIRSAVRAEFPSAPEPLDYKLPLIDALSRPRKYGGY